MRLERTVRRSTGHVSAPRARARARRAIVVGRPWRSELSVLSLGVRPRISAQLGGLEAFKLTLGERLAAPVAPDGDRRRAGRDRGHQRARSGPAGARQLSGICSVKPAVGYAARRTPRGCWGAETSAGVVRALPQEVRRALASNPQRRPHRIIGARQVVSRRSGAWDEVPGGRGNATKD